MLVGGGNDGAARVDVRVAVPPLRVLAGLDARRGEHVPLLLAPLRHHRVQPRLHHTQDAHVVVAVKVAWGRARAGEVRGGQEARHGALRGRACV